MAPDRVEIVRSTYDGWREGDFQTNVELLDPHAVFFIPPEFPDTGAYVGPEAIANYTHGFLEPWTHITIDAEELTPAGDSVLASVVQRGVGDASGAETEFRYFQLWTFRGDKVIRLENFRERAQALAAAGLQA